MRRRLALACLLLVGCTARDAADGPLFGDGPAEGLDLRAAASAESVPLLGEFELTVDLFVGDGREVEFRPDVPAGFRGEVDTRPAVPLGTGTWTRFVVSLRPIELGDLQIPSFEVSDGELTATTAAIAITVGSLLDSEGQANDVEAPAELFPVPPPSWPWFAGGAALLLIAAWLAWRRWRRSHPAALPVETPLPPHVTALRALARLRQAKRTTPTEVEQFYVAVSDVLRTYLEARFGLRAPERTTEEFLPEVESSGVLTVEQGSHLRQFLMQCDLVKFAAAVPGEDVHESTFAFAEELVESTRADRSVEKVPA